MSRWQWPLRGLPAVCLTLVLGGCAPFVLVPARERLTEGDLEVTVPEDGWYRINPMAQTPEQRGEADQAIVLTRDGMALQQIRIQRVPVTTNLKFTKRKFDPRLPPYEAAEVELDNIRSNPNVLNLSVEQNAPATVDGRRGFRLVYSWNTEGGLRIKRVHYGLLEGNALYRLIYQAAARHYFDHDLPIFDRMRESVRLARKPA